MSTLPQSDNGDFNWWGDDEAIVVRAQDAVAIYANGQGGIVLRAQRAWDETDDSLVIVNRSNIIRVIYGMLRAAGYGDFQLYRTNGIACEDVPDPRDDDGSYPDGEEEPDREHVEQTEIRLIENASNAKDPTAAERQRRHRERKRNGRNGHDSVTCHVTVEQIGDYILD
jgi:hypothetical protein